jgi:hypothetical protein
MIPNRLRIISSTITYVRLDFLPNCRRSRFAKRRTSRRSPWPKGRQQEQRTMTMIKNENDRKDTTIKQEKSEVGKISCTPQHRQVTTVK